jgi:hypothetical protein
MMKPGKANLGKGTPERPQGKPPGGTGINKPMQKAKPKTSVAKATYSKTPQHGKS